MAKEIPILFSTPMVQAIIAGRKTQTRREVKGRAAVWLTDAGFTPEFVADQKNDLCRYGKPGDLLWVRESWQWEGDTPFTDALPIGSFFYRADDDLHGPIRWRPSIHMPKEAARIWLRVTDIRIERFHDISEEDACEEGVQFYHDDVQGIRFKDYLAECPECEGSGKVLDEELLDEDDRDHQDPDLGGTGHGDISHSDADPGL